MIVSSHPTAKTIKSIGERAPSIGEVIALMNRGAKPDPPG